MKSVSLKHLSTGTYLMAGDQDIMKKKQEITKWCSETFDKKSWRVEISSEDEDEDVFWYPIYKFLNDEDYMLFCMTWL